MGAWQWLWWPIDVPRWEFDRTSTLHVIPTSLVSIKNRKMACSRHSFLLGWPGNPAAQTPPPPRLTPPSPPCPRPPTSGGRWGNGMQWAELPEDWYLATVAQRQPARPPAPAAAHVPAPRLRTVCIPVPPPPPSRMAGKKCPWPESEVLSHPHPLHQTLIPYFWT